MQSEDSDEMSLNEAFHHGLHSAIFAKTKAIFRKRKFNTILF